VTFVDFKPQTFRRVREHFGVKVEDYAASFASTQRERLTEGGSSDAFFFYSGDGRFIVKSCTPLEFWTLLSMADAYAAYMCDSQQRGTFVVRLYGAHSLKLYGQAFYFLVMEDLFGGDAPATRFDIKGSWVGRDTAPPRPGQRLTCKHCNRKYTHPNRTEFFRGEGVENGSRRRRSPRGPHATLRRRASFEHSSGDATPARDDDFKTEARDETFCPVTVGGEHEPNLTLKDNDLNYAHRLRLDRIDASSMLRQLRRDAAMLADLGIMDYSLLLGVRSVEYPGSVDGSGDGGAENGADDAPDGGDARGGARPRGRRSRVVVRHFYSMGIVDVLQRWTFAKRFEAWWKVNVYGFDAAGISCLPPQRYCGRFVAKMQDLLLNDALSLDDADYADPSYAPLAQTAQSERAS